MSHPDLFTQNANPFGTPLSVIPDTITVSSRIEFERRLQLYLLDDRSYAGLMRSMPDGMLVQFCISRDGDYNLHMQAFNADSPRLMERHRPAADNRYDPDMQDIARAIYRVNNPKTQPFSLTTLSYVRVWEDPEKITRAHSIRPLDEFALTALGLPTPIRGYHPN